MPKGGWNRNRPSQYRQVNAYQSQSLRTVRDAEAAGPMARCSGSRTTSTLCQAITALWRRNIRIDLDRHTIDGFTCDHHMELRPRCALHFLEVFANGLRAASGAIRISRAERRHHHNLNDRASRGVAEPTESSGLPSHHLRLHFSDP